MPRIMHAEINWRRVPPEHHIRRELGLTFDDVLLKPAYSEILPREVSLRTHVTRGITLNIPILWAVACCVLVWTYLWHPRWGYALRTVGQSERAAVYAGIDPRRVVVVTMCISGALAGFVGLNELMGVQHRLLLNFTAGYGFTGIAVSLMGRNHPVGIVLASLLFGVLYQGGAELSFEMPRITREMVVTIQGLVILFSGALAYMLRPWLEAAFHALRRAPAPAE